jgi:hypothetical protein
MSSCCSELRDIPFKMWLRLLCCWVRRRGKDGSAAPILPNPPGFSLLPSDLSNLSFLSESQDQDVRKSDIEAPYPAIDVYLDRDHAISEMEKRNQATGALPKAEVEKIWEKKQSPGN